MQPHSSITQTQIKRLKHRFNDIRYRCQSPSSKDYARYGGRGISLCQEWQDFDAFASHVLSLPNALQPGYSLDRIDNDGDYAPGNVRWATRRQQQNNTRTNRYLSYGGKTQTEVQWARELGIGKTTLNERLRRGWSVERALATPVAK